MSFRNMLDVLFVKRSRMHHENAPEHCKCLPKTNIHSRYINSFQTINKQLFDSNYFQRNARTGRWEKARDHFTMIKIYIIREENKRECVSVPAERMETVAK